MSYLNENKLIGDDQMAYRIIKENIIIIYWILLENLRGGLLIAEFKKVKNDIESFYR